MRAAFAQGAPVADLGPRPGAAFAPFVAAGELAPKPFDELEHEGKARDRLLQQQDKAERTRPRQVAAPSARPFPPTAEARLHG